MKPATKELTSAALGAAIGTGEASGASSLALLLDQIVISKAAEMARAGQRQQAASVLSELMRERGTSASVLDLLARIRAQQGNLSEAESLWEEAARLDPANTDYDDALNRIRRTNRRPAWLASLLAPLIGLVIVVFVIAMLLVARNYLSDFRASVRSDVQAEIASLQARQQSAPESPARQQAAASVPQATEQAPQLQINVAGVSVKNEAGQSVITFSEGLFERGADLRPEAERTLTELGRQLEPYAASVNIVVAGYSDNRSMRRNKLFSDNAALCFARAVAAVEQLRKTTRLPAGILLARAAEDGATVYPNDTPENRERNRTVAVRISTLRK